MPERPRVPENARGDFYVVRDRCLRCGLPHAAAPDLLNESTPDYRECYFRRQPQTEAELAQAIAALGTSCVAAHRYAGNNPDVLARLRSLGCAAQCDQLAADEPRPISLPVAIEIPTSAPPTRPLKLGTPLILLTTITCILALGLSIYPGLLPEVLFWSIMLSFVVVPIAVVAGLIALVIAARRGRLNPIRFTWRSAAILAAVPLVTFALLKFYVPRRIAFRASRPALEAMLAQAPTDRPTALNRRLGIYHVDEYAADSRGGTYFRTFTGSYGIGPDQTSYGFAYRPNVAGSPFGAAGYRVFNLGKGWYWFRASDDWY